MRLDRDLVSRHTVKFLPRRYVRVTPMVHAASPLGMGFGDTRFASPSRSFKLLYIAKNLATGVAETIVRDRFEGSGIRELMLTEITSWGATEVSALSALSLLDLRGSACVALGVSTDIKGAKGQDEARKFSDAIHNQTDVDGILYHSRLTGKPCAAIYERSAGSKLSATPVIELARLAELINVLKALNILLIR